MSTHQGGAVHAQVKWLVLPGGCPPLAPPVIAVVRGRSAVQGRANQLGAPDQCTQGCYDSLPSTRKAQPEAKPPSLKVASLVDGAVQCTSKSVLHVGGLEGRSSASILRTSIIAAEALHSPKTDSQAADDVTIKLTCKGGAAVWGCTWAMHSLKQVSQARLRWQGSLVGLHRGMLHPVVKGALRPPLHTAHLRRRGGGVGLCRGAGRRSSSSRGRPSASRATYSTVMVRPAGRAWAGQLLALEQCERSRSCSRCQSQMPPAHILHCDNAACRQSKQI